MSSLTQKSNQIFAFSIVHIALAATFVLIANLPLHYHINVGVGEGYGGDEPLLQHFNTPEHNKQGYTYRWTKDESQIALPGIGQRPVVLHLTLLPIPTHMATMGPEHIEVWTQHEQLAIVPIRSDGTHYTLAVPPHLQRHGNLHITIHTTTFTPPEDPRKLGVPLDYVGVEALPVPYLVAPDWHAMGMWLLALLLFGMLLLHIVHPRYWATVFVASAGILIALAAWLDPPRWAFGAKPALITVVLCWVLALALRPGLSALAKRLAIPLPAQSLGWLLCIIVLAFGLRYGGRIYPQSMEGDIYFHTNRFLGTVAFGNVYQLARNRGVDFPYPPAGYITLAPAALIEDIPPPLLELAAALVESISAALIYAMVARCCPHSRFPVGLLAASIYVCTAAGFMTSWWSFDTHIYTQAATLLLLTTLLATVTMPHDTAGLRRGTARWLLFVLLCWVFVGHFGFFINTTLLWGVLLLVAWGAAWRGNLWAHTTRWMLLTPFVGALLVALLFFYSAYMPLLMGYVQATLTGDLPELAGRDPVPRQELWHVLWEAGFIQHFGFFPLLLMPVGMWVLFKRIDICSISLAHANPHTHTWGKAMLLLLLSANVLVSSTFALLPFVTLSSQNTRWLMFSAWAIAVGSALSAQLLWHRGRAGRFVLLTMACFVLSNTAVYWLGPLAWRIRPPEPF